MNDALLAAIIGALAGILGTYLGAILKFRKDLEAAYDKDLREKRIEEYKLLWELTQVFPKYTRPMKFGYPEGWRWQWMSVREKSLN